MKLSRNNKHLLTIVKSLIFFLGVTQSFAQDYAIFSTDTTRFRGKSEKFMERINQQVWYINGREMRYGSETIRIQPNSKKLDTILFQRSPKEHFDTIICNISEPNEYRFYFNECCGAFNVKNESKKYWPNGKVIFTTKNMSSDSYIGKIGEIGILLSKGISDTLKVSCGSVMSPNVFNIIIEQIDSCSNEDENCEGICLQEKDSVNWEFSYQKVKLINQFLFLPFSKEPLKIEFNAKEETVQIKTNW